MRITFILVPLVFIFSCCGENETDPKPIEEHYELTSEDSLDATKDSLNIKSEMDMSLVDKENRKEFLKSLAAIEGQYGEQWDFCTCVIKNDSINKAFMNEVSDSEFDRLEKRFDMIDSKCKAFLAQNPNQTPDDRAKHEKKVKDCLKAAGVNN